MTGFTPRTIDDAPAAARPLLEGAEEQLGFVPNLFGVFAAAPPALEAYQAISAAFARTSLSPVEQQVVLLAASGENGCAYCVAAHTVIARGQAVPDDVVAALREGRPLDDPRLEALRRFTLQVVQKRGWVEAADLEAFEAAGYDRAQVLEVILGVTQKTLSNYTNHVAETPLDPAFRDAAWTRPAVSVG